MKFLNGQEVPQNCTINDLRTMLESSDMQTFAIACEALRNSGTTEAYHLLKSKLQVKEKWKYRYILSVIFTFDESIELKNYFINAMQSDDRILVATVLNHLIYKNLWVTDEQILTCVEKNHNFLDGFYYQILLRIASTASNTSRIIELLNNSKSDSTKIAVAECLSEFATKDNYIDIYCLFADSNLSKLRMEACRIAGKFGRGDLLHTFVKDANGHIRKYVNQVLKESQT